MKPLHWLMAIFLVLGLIAPAHAAKRAPPASYRPDVSFTLKTAVTQGKLAFVGVGGEIDGVVNPPLHVEKNAVVQIVLVNGDGAMHDIALPDFNARSNMLQGKDASTAIVFRATKAGEFVYICTVPGHRAAGMEGRLVVNGVRAPVAKALPRVALDPASVPPPLGRRGPQEVRIDLETVELEGRMADGSSYHYWTFNGTVPGPFLRVRVGDTVHVTLRNRADSTMIHSVDFHAVTGPGGGASATQTTPGGETSFTFKALNPGLYVYHCATPMVAHHIANGMYGLILVEPEEGLAKVDREFYVMQGELYTRAPLGQLGPQEFSVDKLLAERPEYFVFNGAVGALTKETALKAKVGETVRIYFGVGGPNFVSSFHVIGEIFDRVYDQAALTAAPQTDVQTTLVPAGGAAVVEFKLDVPGRYILVDHALSRLERGLAAVLEVTGPEDPGIFKADHVNTAGH
ncbi:MAG TPA: copper-containing nitrite reductase [Burkholderiales bacterium]